MSNTWEPSASLIVIEERAKLLAKIRQFFQKRQVLEVDTPLLSKYAATALHIDPIAAIDQVNFNSNSAESVNNLRFLQTSPEYCMKRLLCHFQQDIFQLCKAFRNNETGRLHNPEFTMLEWYRIGFNHHQLMQEVINLIVEILTTNNANNLLITKISYREIFIKYLNIDPIVSSLHDLKNLVVDNIKLSNQFKDNLNLATKQDCQELLFSHLIEPYLLKEHNTILAIYNYPKEQAALAKVTIDQNGIEVAERFEIYINGVEIANGYHELTDPKIQENRFIQDQQLRSKLNKPPLEIDYNLINALKSGMPNCSGVALGIDRLLMIKTNAKCIQEVICFPYDRA